MKIYKKFFLMLLFLVCATGSLFSGAYFSFNVVETLKEFYTTSDSIKKSIDMEEILSVIMKGNYLEASQSFFNSIRIDHSNITPFLLFCFFFPVANNSFKSLKYEIKKQKGITDNWIVKYIPFPDLYTTTWIQLGFIGTLWGFMLIGFKMNQSAKGNARDLDLDIIIDGFGTALLSTFTAVVLVYIFCPLVIQFWRWIHSLEKPTFDHISLGIEKRLEALSESVVKTNNSVLNLNAEIDVLNRNVSKFSLEKIVDEMVKISNSIKSLGNIGKILTDIKKNTDKSARITIEIPQQIEQSQKNIEESISKGSKALDSEIKDAKKNIHNEIDTTNQSIEKKYKNIKGTIDSVQRETIDGFNKKIDDAQHSTRKRINSLEDTIPVLEKNFKNINTQLNTLKTQINSMEGVSTKQSLWFRFFKLFRIRK